MKAIVQYRPINIKQIITILIYAILISLASYGMCNTRHFATTQTIHQVQVLQWTADTAWGKW